MRHRILRYIHLSEFHVMILPESNGTFLGFLVTTVPLKLIDFNSSLFRTDIRFYNVKNRRQNIVVIFDSYWQCIRYVHFFDRFFCYFPIFR